MRLQLPCRYHSTEIKYMEKFDMDLYGMERFSNHAISIAFQLSRAKWNFVDCNTIIYAPSPVVATYRQKM